MLLKAELLKQIKADLVLTLLEAFLASLPFRCFDSLAPNGLALAYLLVECGDVFVQLVVLIDASDQGSDILHGVSLKSTGRSGEAFLGIPQDKIFLLQFIEQGLGLAVGVGVVLLPLVSERYLAHIHMEALLPCPASCLEHLFYTRTKGFVAFGRVCVGQENERVGVAFEDG